MVYLKSSHPNLARLQQQHLLGIVEPDSLSNKILRNCFHIFLAKRFLIFEARCKAGANVIGIIKHLLNKALQEEKILLCGQYVTDRLRLKPEGLGLNPTVYTLYFALNCLEMKWQEKLIWMVKLKKIFAMNKSVFVQLYP